MIEKSTIRLVLKEFFVYPTLQIHLRELSRRIDLSLPTILTATKSLLQEKLLIKKENKVLTILQADRANIRFIRKKRVFNLETLYESGIVDYLSKEYNFATLILFGSFSKGEDIENSDIDLAIITENEKNLNLEKYEKYLKRKISIHEINIKQVSKEFKISLQNGIVLEGYW